MAEQTCNRVRGHLMQVVKLAATPLPQIEERSNRDWVLLGERNDYRNYLIRLYRQSGKHNAIINGKVYYITGKGWQAEHDNPKLHSFIRNANADESLNELTAKVATDLELFNGFALQIIHSRLKGFGIELSHVPYQKVCPNRDLSRFYYTSDWKQSRPERNADWAVFEPYDPHSRTGRQLLWYSRYSPAESHLSLYACPDYIGCIPYIEIDHEIANFHLNNIKNSFWGSFLINLYGGQPTPEEQKKVEKAIQAKFTGTDNAGRFILNFAEGKEWGAELQSLAPAEFDNLFDQLNRTVQQEIFTGHKVTSPMLFGIRAEGQLGGRTELLEAYELFKNTYISHRRQILEEVFNRLAAAAGMDGLLKLVPTEPVSTQMPLSDHLLQSVLSREELRSLISRQYGLDIQQGKGGIG